MTPPPTKFRGDRKRAYRYKITHAWGSMAEQVEVGKHVIDWTYFGRGHTWTVFDFEAGQESGGFTGTYVDKGQKLEDGTYKSEAELEEVAA